MPTCTLTRRVKFAAAHRYRRPDWDEARNVATFGSCAWPNYHGHSYTCDVTVGGAIDPVTGFIANLGTLDAALSRQVIQKFDHRNINLDIPEFADGKLVPSGENISRYILERLQADLGTEARVLRVTIAEDDSLSCTCSAD